MQESVRKTSVTAPLYHKKSKKNKYLFFSALRLRLYSLLPLNDLIIKHAVTFFITFANEKDASHLRAKAIKKDIYN